MATIVRVSLPTQHNIVGSIMLSVQFLQSRAFEPPTGVIKILKFI